MTERIGDFFRKRIGAVQPCVEDLLHVGLGSVQILPMEGNFNLCESLAFVRESTIFYDTSPLAYLPTGKCLWFTLAHELAHVAHHVIVGTPEFFCFKDKREGFADYIAVASMSAMKIDMSSKERIGARKFRELLRKSCVPDNIDCAVRYICEHSDTYRKSDGDYKMIYAAARI